VEDRKAGWPDGRVPPPPLRRRQHVAGLSEIGEAGREHRRRFMVHPGNACLRRVVRVQPLQGWAAWRAAQNPGRRSLPWAAVCDPFGVMAAPLKRLPLGPYPEGVQHRSEGKPKGLPGKGAHTEAPPTPKGVAQLWPRS